jgi:t-SNARE complex subunit (syntaxin)
MGGQRTSFSKLQRDRDKKAKAAAKRERRQERSANPEGGEDAVDVLVDDDGTSELSADDLLKLIESIHQRFDAGTMTYEEFEEQKVDLLGRLPVD